MTLILSLCLDALMGEPKWLWDKLPHPAVLIGRAISWLEARLNKGSARRLAGALMLGVLAVIGCCVAKLITALPLGWLWELLLVAILLAQRSLADHVRDVADALRISLADGRRSVARIVGRDVTDMTAPQVARSAIESAAENFSDGVVAPAFWYLLGGLPGIVIYKIINTADSMVGYRNERYAEFGWASARVDDLVNWLPARLSALLFLAASGRWDLWQMIRRDARLHRSPNAGWPEAALAGVLDVALSGPRSYDGQMREFPFVHAAGAHEIGPDDIDAAVGQLWKAWLVGIFLVMIATLIW